METTPKRPEWAIQKVGTTKLLLLWINWPDSKPSAAVTLENVPAHIVEAGASTVGVWFLEQCRLREQGQPHGL